MSSLEVTGNFQKRFMQISVLLYMLDPVRGRPTAYGLDQHPHDGGKSRIDLLKSKFLDSFALISSTRKEGDAVSAATLEEASPSETTTRVSSNAGVAESTLLSLRRIVDVLNGVAAGDSPLGKETDLLVMIIDLCIEKIRVYLNYLSRGHDFTVNLSELHSKFDAAKLVEFLKWSENLQSIASLSDVSDTAILASHIRWASKARWEYAEYLDVAFCPQGETFPPWIHSIYKLGRYAVASKALLQLALHVPALFCPMRVETVTAPLKQPFSVSEDEQPLTLVLRRVIGGELDVPLAKIGQLWNQKDVNELFRGVAAVDLAVHAEMQLLGYYGDHPEKVPSFRYIGVSKKSCFLCDQFLQRHSLGFHVSSSHQKLYLSWRPPPATNSAAYRRHRDIIAAMCESMEKIAREELSGRLIGKRAPAMDSTAGVSLTGLTSLGSGARIKATVVRQTIPEPLPSVSASVSDLQPLNTAYDMMSLNDIEKEPNAITSMTFHVFRADDDVRQDLIAAGDMVDPRSGEPSWSRFVQLMSVDDPFGVQFKEGEEFLMVNNRIRVGSDRQFRACLQFLCNSNCLNSEVKVQSYHSLRLGDDLGSAGMHSTSSPALNSIA